MFNFKYKLLTLLTILTIVVACSDDTSSPSAADSVKSTTITKSFYDVAILDDKDFVDYLNDSYTVIARTNEEEILKIDSEGIPVEENYKRVLLALGFNGEADYIDYHNVQSQRLANVERKFGLSKFTPGEQEQIFIDGFIRIKIINPDTETYMSCIWKKRWCDAGVIGAAAAGQAACLGMDVATAGASAIAGCHFGVALLQASGHALCIANYEDCMAGN